MAHNDLTIEQILEEIKERLGKVEAKLDILIGHEEAEEAELESLTDGRN